MACRTFMLVSLWVRRHCTGSATAWQGGTHERSPSLGPQQLPPCPQPDLTPTSCLPLRPEAQGSPAPKERGSYLPIQLRGLYVAQPMGFTAGEEEEVSLSGETR